MLSSSVYILLLPSRWLLLEWFSCHHLAPARTVNATPTTVDMQRKFLRGHQILSTNYQDYTTSLVLDQKEDASNYTRLTEVTRTQTNETATDDEEEYDYETFHSRLNIPVPAVRANLIGLMRLGTSQQQHNALQGFYEEENASQQKHITLQGLHQENNSTEEFEFAHSRHRFLQLSEVGKGASGRDAVSTASLPAHPLPAHPQVVCPNWSSSFLPWQSNNIASIDGGFVFLTPKAQ